jgi:hypothetical protein
MTGLTASSLGNHIQVVQAIAGCVQLRASSPSSTLWLDTIGQQLRGQAGVYTVNKDATTGNLIILFDPSLLPLPQMLGILQQSGIFGMLGQQTTTMQVGGFLQEHHEFETLLPMIAGMLVTETLKLRGGWALLANLMAASFTRQVIEQLEETSASVPPVVAVEGFPQPATAAPQPMSEKRMGAWEESQSPRTGETPGLPSPQFPLLTPQALETLQTSSVRVVHAVPGRVRLRVPQLTDDPDYAQRLQKLLSSDELVTRFRINAQAASIVIAYEIGGISDNEMRSHLINLIHSSHPDNYKSEEESPAPLPVSSLQTQAISTQEVINELGDEDSGQSSPPVTPQAQTSLQTFPPSLGGSTRASGFIRGVNPKSKIQNPKSNDQSVQRQPENSLNSFKPSFVCALFNSLAGRFTPKAQV